MGRLSDNRLQSWKLFAAKSIRGFGIGLIVVSFPTYLSYIGIGSLEIGAIFSIVMAGTAFLLFFISYRIRRLGRRTSLFLFTAIVSLAAAGVAFSNTFFVLLPFAFFANFSLGGSDTSVFLPLEQSLLPDYVSGRERNRTFAVYNTSGYLAVGFGVLSSSILYGVFGGGLPGYRGILFVYMACLILNAAIYATIPGIGRKQETRRLLDYRSLSPRSRSIIRELAFLFAIDAFAGGLVLQSVIAYWFHLRFNASLESLSYVFAAVNFIIALSLLLTPWIAGRIGVVRTMVFTHLPSNILLLLIAFAPTFTIAVVILLLRQSISQMDVPTRQSYVMAVTSDSERPQAAAITGLGRSVASASSPWISGAMLQFAALGLPFILGGVLKSFYDLVLLWRFDKIKPPEEMADS